MESLDLRKKELTRKRTKALQTRMSVRGNLLGPLRLPPEHNHDLLAKLRRGERRRYLSIWQNIMYCGDMRRLSLKSTDVIVVLGNRLRSEDIHQELRGRMDVAFSLRNRILERQPRNKIIMILTGGVSNKDVPLSEAEVMRRYGIVSGIPEDEVIVEAQSLDTIGNGLFTRKIVDTIKNVAKIYVVSSCYHTERIKYIFDMCYGGEYNLNFDHCHMSETPKPPEKEWASLMRAREFFVGIRPGYATAIEEKLFNEHDLYKTKS